MYFLCTLRRLQLVAAKLQFLQNEGTEKANPADKGGKKKTHNIAHNGL